MFPTYPKFNQFKNLIDIWSKVWVWVKTSNDTGHDAVKFFSVCMRVTVTIFDGHFEHEHVWGLYQEHCVSKWWFQRADWTKLIIAVINFHFIMKHIHLFHIYRIVVIGKFINKKQSKNSTEADFFGMFNSMWMEKTVFEFINQPLEKEKQNINYHKRAIIVSSCPFK